MPMAVSRQAGFTIIEVSLFLAITGLLFLIAVLGTGNTIRNVRFTDSGRSLESFVQKQYDDIINGVNTRDDQISCISGTISTSASQEVGTSNCLLIGKLIVFWQNNSNVSYYDVIGTEPSTVNYAQTDEDLITSFDPKAVTASESKYSIPWGAYPSGFKRLSDNSATNALLLVRSPKSTRIVSYTFKVATTVPDDLTSIVSTEANQSQETNFCIESADGLAVPAKLYISGGSSQSSASIIFDASGSDCDGI